MPAYAVFIREKTVNQKELEIYWSKVEETFAGLPIKILAAYGTQQTLEGPPSEGTVIAQFPTVADARKWYDSAAYQSILHHRQKGAVYRALIVEGV